LDDAGWVPKRTFQSTAALNPVAAIEGILVEAVGHEPRFVPGEVLLADECTVARGALAALSAEKRGCHTFVTHAPVA
jgi:hypothetical protein